jgi:hypothetical protein
VSQAEPLPYTPDSVTPLAADPSLAEVDNQPADTAVGIEVAHTAVDTAVDHTAAAVDSVEVVDTEAVAHTEPLVHSSSVQLVRALLLADCHSPHKSASPMHSAAHSLCKPQGRLELVVGLGPAYYVHSGHRKQSQREPARGRQDRGES